MKEISNQNNLNKLKFDKIVVTWMVPRQIVVANSQAPDSKHSHRRRGPAPQRRD